MVACTKVGQGRGARLHACAESQTAADMHGRASPPPSLPCSLTPSLSEISISLISRNAELNSASRISAGSISVNLGIGIDWESIGYSIILCNSVAKESILETHESESTQLYESLFPRKKWDSPLLAVIISPTTTVACSASAIALRDDSEDRPRWARALLDIINASSLKKLWISTNLY